MISIAIITFTLISMARPECSTTIESSTADDTLRMVHLLFRHGDRAPVEHFPNDPFKNKSSEIWPEGLGQLTKIGKAMAYKLGLWLRNRYGSLIKDQFDPEEIYVFSTDYDRTLMSAESVLAAFYRPDEDEEFREDLLWTPTPIHTAPAGYDKLLNVNDACPKIAEEFERVQKLPEVVEFYDENEELLNDLTLKSGSNMTTPINSLLIYDTLFIERLYNLTIPDWAAEKYDEMESFSDHFFKLISYTTELKRLGGGPLLKTIAENMKNKSNDLTNREMLMYSAHDTTVSTLLNSMGVYNGVRPPYSATVLIELHEIDKNYFVKMFYQNDTNIINPPHELILPGCSFECPLSKWIYLLRDVIPEDWDEECKVSDPLTDHDNASQSKKNYKNHDATNIRKGILARALMKRAFKALKYG